MKSKRSVLKFEEFVIEYIGEHSETLVYLELYVSPSANYFETEKKVTSPG